MYEQRTGNSSYKECACLLKGLRGEKGAKGSTGEKGEGHAGQKGEAGLPGVPGLPGTSDAQNATICISGSKGAVGQKVVTSLLHQKPIPTNASY